MNNIKTMDEPLLVFRGVAEDKVQEIVAQWMEWCAHLSKALLRDAGKPVGREGKMVSGEGVVTGQTWSEPEIPFLALPYAVRVGAKRRAPVDSLTEESEAVLTCAAA